MDLLKVRRIQISRISSRFELSVKVVRCFRSFDYLYRQAHCTGLDRNRGGLCFKWEEKIIKKEIISP